MCQSLISLYLSIVGVTLPPLKTPLIISTEHDIWALLISSGPMTSGPSSALLVGFFPNKHFSAFAFFSPLAHSPKCRTLFFLTGIYLHSQLMSALILHREKRSDWVKAPWSSPFQIYPCEVLCAYASAFLLTTKENVFQILSLVNLFTSTWFYSILVCLRNLLLQLFFFSLTLLVRGNNLDHPYL